MFVSVLADRVTAGDCCRRFLTARPRDPSCHGDWSEAVALTGFCSSPDGRHGAPPTYQMPHGASPRHRGPGAPGTRAYTRRGGGGGSAGPRGCPAARPALSAQPSPATEPASLVYTGTDGVSRTRTGLLSVSPHPVFRASGQVPLSPCRLLGSFPQGGLPGAGQATRVGSLSSGHLCLSLVQQGPGSVWAAGVCGAPARAAGRGFCSCETGSFSEARWGGFCLEQKLTWMFPLFQTERLSLIHI